MGKRRSEPFGIPIAPAIACIGPLARRLVRWWLVWILFVVVAWASVSQLLWRVDATLNDHPQSLGTLLPIDESDVPVAPSAWCNESAAAARQPTADDLLGRNIDIDLRAGQATASMSAEFATCSSPLARLIETMTREPLDTSGQRRVEETVFGYVTLGGGEKRYASLQMLAGEAATTVTVKSSFTEASPSAPSNSGPAALAARTVSIAPSTWTARATHIRIRFDAGTGAWTSNTAPLHQTADEIVWDLKGSDGFVSAVFRSPVAAVPTSGHDATSARTAHDIDAPLLIRALAGDIGGLRWLWLGVTVALPFALLWLWATRTRAFAGPDAQAPLLDALMEGCGLAIGLVAALALAELSERLLADLEWLPRRFQFFNLAWTASICKTALIASALVAFGTWAAPARRTGNGLPLAVAGAALAVGGWLLDPANLAHFTGRMSAAGVDSIEGRIGLGIEGVGALLIAGGLTVEAFRWGLVLRGALVLVAAVLAIALLDHVQLLRFHLPFLASLLALPFGWAFASVSRGWLPHRPPVPLWVRAAGALFAAVLALPPDFERNWSQGWLVSATAWALVRWWQLAALILLLLWFARNERPPSAGRRSPAYFEGAAVFLFIVFFWNAQLSFVPLAVETATGLAVLRWGVFAPRQLSAPTRRHRFVSKTIEDLRGFNALARLRRMLLKAQDDKLAKGELDAQGWLDRRDRDERVMHRRAATARRGRLRAMLALNLGPRGDAWQRGTTGALATTALALPWIATFLTHTTFQPRNATNAATLSQLGAVAFDLLRWPALGFFFLYFYPLLRGINGIQKGLTLAACVIVPSAAATLVSSATGRGPWTAFALWSLQIFICCMSVGVGLGDLGALRKVGKGPRALVEIYNLGTLTAWFTSIAIAVGAAATTTIASGAGAILSVGLKLLIPEAQTVPLSTHP